MTLNRLRFRALRLLWTTAHADLNKTLDMLTLLAVLVATPYLAVANTVTGSYQTGLYLLELIAVFLGRRWFKVPPVPAAWLLLLTSAVHIFILAFQEGGVASISVVWMLALSMPMLLVFGLRGALISMALSTIGAAVLAWLDYHRYTPALPEADQDAWASGIKFTLVVITVVSFPIITVIAQRWVIRMSARRVSLLDKAKQATRDAQIRQQQFISSVSHELRTPMNAIMGFIQSPPGALLKTHENRALFEAMRQASKHLMTVIDDLMDFSRLQTGELKITPIETQLDQLTREISQIFSSQLADRGIVFKLAVDAQVPAVARLDPNRYAQIVINLLSNAAKFTSKGEVALTVVVLKKDKSVKESDPVWIRVTVSDTGIGIEPDQLDRLFEAFSPSNKVTSNAFGGAGLGLSISKKLVELMGGRIAATSQIDGGTSVYFDLPVELVLAPTLALESPPADDLSSLHTRHLRVLVVDDSVVNRLVLSQLLQSRLPNAITQEVADGIEAVAAIQGAEFDLILMDILMPNLNGIEATRRIKAMGYTVPIIGLTADISDVVTREATAAGMCNVLTKPFSHSELLSTIADAIRRPTNHAAPVSAMTWTTRKVPALGAPPTESATEGPAARTKKVWEKQIEALTESSPRTLLGKVFVASTFVCAFYAFMVPDSTLQRVYVGMTCISLSLCFAHQLCDKSTGRTNLLAWIFWLSTTAATACLVAWSGGLNSIASAYFLCVPLIMLTQGISHSGYAVAIGASVALLMGSLQAQGYLHTPTANQMADHPWWSFILFVGLAFSFLIIPLLRFAYYGTMVTSMRQKSAQLLTSRRATAAVIQAQNDFVAAVSHELRNPIHAISLVVSAFDEAVLDNPTSKTTLKYVSRSVSDLLRTIDNLLIFSQIKAEKLNLNYEFIDLPQWLLSVRRYINELTVGMSDQDPATIVNFELDPNLPPFVEADPVRLRHLVRELVSNAAKFSNGKPITVGMRMDQTAVDATRTWSISITDRGTGINPGWRDDILSPFGNTGNRDQPHQQGTGLGLPITKALVEGMGGVLGIESNPTEGTKVTVTLPLRSQHHTGKGIETSSGVARSFKGVIAIVDDSEVNLVVLRQLLERHFPFATVITANSWVELAKLIEQHHPTVVLMDVFMPKVDGCKATGLLRQQVKASHRTQPIVIGVTADRRDETRLACIEAGMTTVVLKPFNHYELVQIIANQCAPKRSAQTPRDDLALDTKVGEQ